MGFSEWHFTGLDGTATHYVVPNLTKQDSIALDSTAFGCSGLDGTGRVWAELTSYGLHCSALHLTGLESTAVDL